MARIRIPFSYDKLHPKAADHFRLIADRLAHAHRLGRTKDLIKAFEGYRPPESQLELVRLGTSKAKPWQSAHNYGLAVDFVPWSEGLGFHWPAASHPDWNVLQEIAVNSGMVCAIAWDRPHVESPIWTAVRSHLI